MRRTWGVLHVFHERRSSRTARLLRPVLLAGAATGLWLALSATAASAETGADPDTQPGVTTALSSLTPSAPESTRPLADPISGGDSSGLLSPVLAAVTDSADGVVASIPVARVAAPVSQVVNAVPPAVELAEDAVAGVVEAVVSVGSEVLPGAAPVLDPPADGTTGALPLPPVAAAPSVPAATVPDSPDPSPGKKPGAPISHHRAVASGGNSVIPAAVEPTAASTQSGPFRAPLATVRTDARPQQAGDFGGGPGGGDLPELVPAVPGSVTGSSQSPSGPGAATVTATFQLQPPSGMPRAAAPLLQASPAVSFDPGSSPD